MESGSLYGTTIRTEKTKTMDGIYRAGGISDPVPYCGRMDAEKLWHPGPCDVGTDVPRRFCRILPDPEDQAQGDVPGKEDHEIP